MTCSTRKIKLRRLVWCIIVSAKACTLPNRCITKVVYVLDLVWVNQAKRLAKDLDCGDSDSATQHACFWFGFVLLGSSVRAIDQGYVDVAGTPFLAVCQMVTPSQALRVQDTQSQDIFSACAADALVHVDTARGSRGKLPKPWFGCLKTAV